MKDKKHLYWVVGLVLITIILCGTLIWINYNSWTLRFEMDDNTKEAILSFNFSEINEVKPIQTRCFDTTDCFDNPQLEGCEKRDCNWACCFGNGMCATTLIGCGGLK